LRDFQRRRAQQLGERKNRDREIAQRDFWGLLDDHDRQSSAGVALQQKLGDALGQTPFEIKVQSFPLRFLRRSDFNRARCSLV